MKSKKSSIGKWLGLLAAFFVAMCCICIGFALITTGATNNLAASAPVAAPATATVEEVLSVPMILENLPTALPTALADIPTATSIPLPTSTAEQVEVLAVPLQQPAGDLLLVHFINVGQGDATLIQTPEGYTALIDGGEKGSGVVQYLQSLGVKRIDLLIATHPHSDHIGGLVQVLSAFPVSKVVTNGQPHTTSVYESFLDGIAAAQAEYVEVRQGDLLQLGSLNFLVLSPAANTNDDLNENSLVLRFGYGNTTFLMMGDAGRETEASLLASGQSLKADVLKVGHHGSSSASSPAFLDAVKPKVAIYSAGINNKYNHPAPETIAALTAAGASIYGTDTNGEIDFEIDLNGYNLNSQGIQSRAPPVVIFPEELPTATGEAPAAVSGIPGLEIVSVTSPVRAGANATLIAKTTPGASCGITVYYKSGPSSAQGLGPKTAGANGEVSWTWKVGSRTSAGTWRIVVNCSGLTQETSFTVQ